MFKNVAHPLDVRYLLVERLERTAHAVDIAGGVTDAQHIARGDHEVRQMNTRVNANDEGLVERAPPSEFHRPKPYEEVRDQPLAELIREGRARSEWLCCLHELTVPRGVAALGGVRRNRYPSTTSCARSTPGPLGPARRLAQRPTSLAKISGRPARDPAFFADEVNEFAPSVRAGKVELGEVAALDLQLFCTGSITRARRWQLLR